MFQYRCIRSIFWIILIFLGLFASRKEGSHLAMISEQLARSSLDKLAEKNPQSSLSDMKS
jgi:hypothetical protein